MSDLQLKEKIYTAITEGNFKNLFKEVRIFGSRFYGTETKDSDVDLLVSFTGPVSYFQIARIENFFQEALHIKVDLVTKSALSPHMKDDVLQESEIIYEKR